jgi:hypothetical protein
VSKLDEWGDEVIGIYETTSSRGEDFFIGRISDVEKGLKAVVTAKARRSCIQPPI